jgi:hypothetical protein
MPEVDGAGPQRGRTCAAARKIRRWSTAKGWLTGGIRVCSRAGVRNGDGRPPAWAGDGKSTAARQFEYPWPKVVTRRRTSQCLAQLGDKEVHGWHSPQFGYLERDAHRCIHGVHPQGSQWANTPFRLGRCPATRRDVCRGNECDGRRRSAVIDKPIGCIGPGTNEMKGHVGQTSASVEWCECDSP